jgi:predicted RNase H-like HicB family nuclease
MNMRVYTVHCQRSGGWWAITIPEVPGAFTQTRRLDQVDSMARDVIALMLGVPEDSFSIQLAPVLDERAQKVLEQVDQAKGAAEDAQRQALAAMSRAARTLVRDEGLTVRDAGRLLGVSFQRVSQLVSSRKP